MDADEGTLAGASGQGVDKLLSKIRNRAQGRGKSHADRKGNNFLAAAGDVSVLPKGPEPIVQDGICGAPALLHGPVEDAAGTTARPAGRSRVEDAPADIISWLPAWNEAGDDDDEWEDHSDLEDLQYNEQGVPTAADQHDASIIISFDKGGEEQATLRHKFTAEERLAAAVVHQSHLLCLLARGHLYDLAAADPLVQAVASSLAPEERIRSLQPRERMVTTRLTSLLEWYKDAVQLSAHEREPSEADLEEVDNHGGVVTTAARLQAVALKRTGSADDLVALFAALLRSQGLLVRFVRALDPLSHQPTLKDRRYVPTVPRRPPNTAPRKRKDTEANGAQANGKKARSGRASTGTARGRGRSTKRGKAVEPESKGDEASSSSDEGEKERTEDQEPSGSGPASKQKKGKAAQGGSGKAGGGSAKPKAADADFQAPAIAVPETSPRRTRAKKRSTAVESPFKGEPAVDQEGGPSQPIVAACEAGQADEPANERKRRGDLEFENQLAMAMMASTSGSLPQPEESKSSKPGEAQMNGALRRGKAQGTGWTSARSVGRSQAADTWVEVYCDGEDEGRGRWVHVQPLLGWIDRPEDVERGSARYMPLAYVVAFAGGGAKDVTVRYVQSMVKAEKVRSKNGKWWNRTLRPMRSAEVDATRAHLASAAPPSDCAADTMRAADDSAPNAVHGNGVADPPRAVKTARNAKPAKILNLYGSDERLMHEDKVLKAKRQEDDLAVPTTVDGFKKHKMYILERHIGRYSALRPGAPKAGMHRGEAFYSTEDISELHTAEKWVQAGREVQAGELAQPFKVVAKRGTKAKGQPAKDAGDYEEDAMESEGQADANQTKLYGMWQTEPWQPPVAMDGMVPKNERGTVLCPPLAPSLPEGTVQVNLPRVVAICKRWNVDYGMAMTGFDIRGGRSAPRFEGVIICKEFEEIVRTEWRNEQQEQAEKAAAKRMEFSRVTWGNLLKAIFTRLGLQDTEAAQGTAKNTPAKRKPGKQGKKAMTAGADANGRGSEHVEEHSTPAKNSKASKRVRTSKAAGVDARQVADLDAMNGGEIGEHDLEHHEGEGWKKTKTGLLAEVEDI